MEQRAPSKNALFSWSDGLQESPSTSYQICSRAAMFTQTMHRMGGASTPPPQGGARQVARKEPQQARRDAQKQAQPAAAAAQKKKTLALHRDPGFSNSRNSSQSNVNIGAVQEHNRSFTMASLCLDACTRAGKRISPGFSMRNPFVTYFAHHQPKKGRTRVLQGRKQTCRIRAHWRHGGV